ncbi:MULTISPECIES: ABC transporter ATP-binding protein [unclassified Streptomyces]|uniref:ABC transporter ATP-binding protein n=1 Tax=unclassified Streptomyces TaxID=2593676 RepID=UPI000DB9F9FF|nr:MULTISPECIES: ABC transporter ATP-binding protein [unclassified Streptomyces]MYT69156.1 ATP-binding cassette domain-containing protein [Streptomyces sp. SID8367]RAJ82670.1 ATP-binding cassette subfamily C protein [Streptomyces sp. PsTaAH-137]
MTTTPRIDEQPLKRSADDDRAAPDAPGDLLPVADARRTRAAAWELLRPDRYAALRAGALLVAATAVGLLTQPLIGRIVDLVADRRSAQDVLLTAGLVALVALAQGAATALGLALLGRLGETALARLRERFVQRALALPADRLERAGAGDLTARVTTDVARVSEAVGSALPELVRSGLTIVLTLGALLLLDPRFLLAALLAAPVQFLTARWYVRRAVPLYAAQRVADGSQQQQLLETLGGADTVRAYRLEKAHTAHVARRSLAAVALNLRGTRLVLGFYGRLHIAEYIGLIAVLYAGFVLVRADAVSIGTATAAALYFHNLFGPVNAALVLLDDAQSATAGLARLVGVTDLGGAPAGADTGRDESWQATVLDVDRVGHSYGSGRPVLTDISLTLRRGEHVALVGASGAGKSTLARIVAGVQDPTHGTVTRAPAQPGAGPPAVLVSQELHVFAGPLTDDLRLGRPDADDAALRAALSEVGALDWALALPDGLDTVVGDGGHPLDAVQAQQLALARLVLADPAVAVLDEATAEAGSAGARVLERSARDALRGRTALIVAHRLTQAVTADRVVVLERGRVVESGPHEDLAHAGGRYAELWAAWSGERPAEGA